ncbi:unnamed protein product [Rotaria magnacalcarata]|uniref:Uncharacterized protein n=1 Tax=Rotaria magnacalcarata TaxID=392030 RepID=A0A816LNZ2_9BILA|nr:unnamed protein product [Rotaria magnacalcarata]CAF1618604.1 unnamed protein product [Rotaria magnacalcarata]CAF1964060.1 unnamed protein product [Rotaria magnacalcarata]CAF2069411.1 unnamed protein product [Rotaria magnacalcarata]CAF2117948.1 unnamed protein product [Rotaria magnacalcarata]
MSSIPPNSPIIDSVSDSLLDRTSSSSSPSLSLSTELFNRLQAFQVYLEMSGSIDALTDCVAQLNVSYSSSYSSPLEQFKAILRSKIPQTIEADCLQQEIDELKLKLAQIRQALTIE